MENENIPNLSEEVTFVINSVSVIADRVEPLDSDIEISEEV